MLRLEIGQNFLLPVIFLLSLLTFFNFSDALAQKINFDTLEIDQGIKSTDQNISIIARISPNAVLRGDRLTLQIFGRIDQGHHLYSVRQQGEFAPDPTKIVVMGSILTAASQINESATLLIDDDAFDAPLQVHKNDFWISRQYYVNKRVKPGDHQLRGYLIYQICDNRICSLPLKAHFQEQLTVNN